jgi:hypothetical protein
MNEKRALRAAKLKAKKKARRKMEEAVRMEPERCQGCELPMRNGQTYKHQWCM